MSSEVLQQAVNIFLQYVGKMSEGSQVCYLSKSWQMSMNFVADMRQSKHPCLVGATCVSIAYKMELNNGLYRPSYMCRNIAHLREYIVYYFITVERDILRQCRWHLFEIKTPNFFMQMLLDICEIQHDNISLQADVLVCKCMQHDKLLSYGACSLAVACVVIALKRWHIDGVYIHKISAGVHHPLHQVVLESMYVQGLLDKQA